MTQDKQDDTKNNNANQMWGGRFSASPSEVMTAINASISYDKRLYEQDIMGSKAHARMLSAQGIISENDMLEIHKGLDQVLSEIRKGRFSFTSALEDIHMNIEARLKEIIGEPAGRLHTARSRNDQVATDMKLYVRHRIDALDSDLANLQKALLSQAETHFATVMPGFTHLQTAQPVTFGHHCLAYVEMLARDRGRFSDARKRLNECPLGSAALAGTAFPLNRDMTANELGFDRPTANSLDAVSDRDFILETLSAGAILATHLSRLAEELVIWTSAPFNFVRLSDQFSTGSSIMPQKRNPDAAELVRAKTGRIMGALVSMLTVMKGLPLAYSKDMQEDKEMTFDALDNLALIVAAMGGMMADLKVNEEKMRAAAGGGFSTATDLADWLVREANVPFRDAHHITGRAVALAEQKGVSLEALALSELQEIDGRITQGVFDVLSVDASVNSRTSFGGTAPENVKRMATLWREKLGD